MAFIEYQMNRETAEGLVNELIAQFNTLPFAIQRMEIDAKKQEKLVKAIENTYAHNHDKKMQFPVPGDETESGISEPISADNPSGKFLQKLYPRRVFTNYNVDPKKSRFEQIGSGIEEMVYNKELVTILSEVICREMREEEPVITEIRKRSMAAGNRYSIMAHFSVALPTHTKEKIYVHLPLFFIPGASKEEQELLAVYAMSHQHPAPESLGDYVQHGVFEEKVMEKYYNYLKEYYVKSAQKVSGIQSGKKASKKEPIPFLGK